MLQWIDLTCAQQRQVLRMFGFGYPEAVEGEVCLVLGGTDGQLGMFPALKDGESMSPARFWTGTEWAPL
jgi:hypothetical protein